MLVLSFPVFSFGQALQQWRYFGPKDGMGMAFYKIHQDHFGFLWCASSNGLYRYDGHRFKAYKKYVTHSDSILSDFIWDILEDEQHNMWLATYDGGVHKWERKTGRFAYFRHHQDDPASLASDNVLRMMLSKKGVLWLIVETEGGVPVLERLDPATGRVHHFRHHPENALSLNSDTISVVALAGSPLSPMIEGQEGQIWVATNRGLNLYVPAGDGFRSLAVPWKTRGEQIIHLYESPAVPGLIWILTATEGLRSGNVYQLNSQSLQITPMNVPLGGLLSYAPTGIFHPPGRAGELWLSSRELCRINLKDGTFNVYVPELKPTQAMRQGLRDSLFLLHPGPSGQLRLVPMSFPQAGHTRGSEDYYIRNGMYQLMPGSSRLQLLDLNPVLPNASFGMVYSINSGQRGDTWIGCFPGFYQFREEGPGQRFWPVFDTIRLWDPPTGPANLSAWAAIERPDGILWVATFTGGLKRIGLQTGAITHFRHSDDAPTSIADDKVYALFEDEEAGKLWIGTDTGLDWVELAALGRANPDLVFHHQDLGSALADKQITSISRGPDGLLWIGTTSEGLLLFDAANETIVAQYNGEAGEGGELNSPFINTVFTDSQGRAWIANGMGGLCQAMPREETPNRYAFQCHLEGMYIVDIVEMADGRLWLAAMNYGIAIFDPKTQKHELWNMENHLNRNSVLGIEQGQNGKIWFTSLGISRYAPRHGTFRHFGQEAGIKDEDPGRLLFTLRDGRMIYSSINGWLQVFDPGQLVDNPTPPQVAITGLQYYDQAKKANVPLHLDENIEVAGGVHLAYHQQPFVVEYVGIDLNDPQGVQYAFQLEGYETQWNNTRERSSGRYLKVPPGKYTFLLKAANSDGQWTAEPLRFQVTISPPLWQTRPAILAYCLAAMFLLYWLFTFQRRRMRLNAQLEFKQREAEQLKELDAIKARFFTDIAHELRTPLTVIGGVAEQLREDAMPNLKKGLEMILRNARQLLRLANQLLDLSMVESGSMEVNRVQSDVISFIRATQEPFAALAAGKGIRWKARHQARSLEMDYDPDKLQKILSNLLSNALKFTPRGGAVTLSTLEVTINGAPHLQVTVEDTGKGIPAGELPHIFERGFRGRSVHPGAGIGLALTRELASLLGGTIEAQSPDGAGATFRLLLPIRNQGPRAAVPFVSPEEESLPQSAKKISSGSHRGLNLLIVEDNEDVIHYLSVILHSDYSLAVARNGKEGLEMAAREVPDIIISDIMMPEMDGLELCRQLKNRLETSHIPILLLTARSDVRSRTQGYETGADAYLPKPFDKKELLAQLRQLTENRTRLQRHLRATLLHGAPTAGFTPKPDREEEFLLQAYQVVVDNLSNVDFGPAELQLAMKMSKTQLHNKLTALAGRSTALFIRGIRLKYAKQALEQNPDLTVKQAAYDFGFKDPNYFSRCFKKEFNISPKEARF